MEAVPTSTLSQSSSNSHLYSMTSTSLSKVITGVNIVQELGRGNFGVVYKGEWNSAPVALKLLKSEHMNDFEREVSTLE
jgi:serine/threonine protein kinase